MYKSVKKKWTDALRSGKYTQGFMRLKMEENFCVLGVLADVLEARWIAGIAGDFVSGGDNARLTPQLVHLAGLTKEICSRVAVLNDGGMSFTEIAYWIDQNIVGWDYDLAPAPKTSVNKIEKIVIPAPARELVNA